MKSDMQNTSVLKEGFLVKRGHIVHNWKVRWFVLRADKLLYYRYEAGKRDSCHRGSIPLNSCEITCPYLEYENRPLVLRLKTKSMEEYFLEASSREERDEWAAEISAAAQKLQPGDAKSLPLSVRKPSQSLQPHSINLSEVVDAMYDLHSGIKMSSHVEQGSTYINCFSGSAVVDWLVFSQLAMTRMEAVTLASTLLDEGCVRAVGVKSVAAVRNAALGEQFLDDSTALYSFAEGLRKRGSVKAEKSLSAVELSGRVQKRGYLVKQGHKVKNWKVRLFVLRSEPGFLHYYDPSKDDISPTGGFALRGCLVSSLDDNGIPSGVKGKVQGNLFKIITQTDKHYFIQAPTHQEKMEWIEAIKRYT
ncbi:pleckstrin-2 [Trichomycterus rosablanca]|uniref:pleckstrin-2 n=1 Tax=Trichomycterus rosablanca TaxID=2290929 RepID=UPI002F357232